MGADRTRAKVKLPAHLATKAALPGSKLVSTTINSVASRVASRFRVQAFVSILDVVPGAHRKERRPEQLSLSSSAKKRWDSPE